MSFLRIKLSCFIVSCSIILIVLMYVLCANFQPLSLYPLHQEKMSSGEDQKDLMEMSSGEDELEEKITQIKRRKVKNRKVETPLNELKQLLLVKESRRVLWIWRDVSRKRS